MSGTDEIKHILDFSLANRSTLIEMSNAAIITAGERPWSQYQMDLAEFVLQNNV
jgi:hypothetical protein